MRAPDLDYRVNCEKGLVHNKACNLLLTDNQKGLRWHVLPGIALMQKRVLIVTKRNFDTGIDWLSELKTNRDGDPHLQRFVSFFAGIKGPLHHLPDRGLVKRLVSTRLCQSD
jgi:hypothetical protein